MKAFSAGTAVTIQQPGTMFDGQTGIVVKPYIADRAFALVALDTEMQGMTEWAVRRAYLVATATVQAPAPLASTLRTELDSDVRRMIATLERISDVAVLPTYEKTQMLAQISALLDAANVAKDNLQESLVWA